MQEQLNSFSNKRHFFASIVVVVVLGLYVPPAAKVIRRQVLLASPVGFEPAWQRYIASLKPTALPTELSGRLTSKGPQADGN